jgi:serine/threonine protein phosphatase PrpC
MANMKICGQTDIGLTRKSNQDAFKIGIISQNCVWGAVCDGMGGVNGGNIASSIASDTIQKIISDKLNEHMSDEEIISLMNNAIETANEAVYLESVNNSECHGMGTTVVLAIMRGNDYFITYIGDSRAYILNETTAVQVTIDHSYVQDLVNRGEITREEAKHHPRRNIITRSLGVHSSAENDTVCGKLKENEVLLLCSDGLSNSVDDSELVSTVHQQVSDEIASDLIGKALKNGANDNVTVLIIGNN